MPSCLCCLTKRIFDHGRFVCNKWIDIDACGGVEAPAYIPSDSVVQYSECISKEGIILKLSKYAPLGNNLSHIQQRDSAIAEIRKYRFIRTGYSLDNSGKVF